MRRPALMLSILLASCGKAPVAPAPETDPAVADALADPIMADPTLALSQGRTGQIGVPVGVAPMLPVGLPTLGQFIRANRKGPFAGCGDRLAYGYGWSAMLPNGVTLPGNAKVIEAAGKDVPGCNLRLVRYAVSAAPADALQYWQTTKGFLATTVDGGVNLISRNTAVRAIANAAPSGATVDLITRTK
jgi:hypothetical protein